MSRRDYFNRQTSFSWSQNYASSSKNSATSSYSKSCTFGFISDKSEFSPVEFLKHIAERVARAIRFVSEERRRRRRSTTRRRRRNLPQDSCPSLVRSDSRAGGGGGSVDSYRSDAVEDCIEFMHSSFSRPNSSANSRNT
ncbi:hypothetical protein QN277_018314 [Acacia crassicarpa]|uniref:Josephin-like protein n=1 Tax=Acacia crassicarpa TaxID=499986 RepID=A0AAE1JQA2_9FABA|nr:hypothetical protein QN277_018314 [Acacia crassicarpa]